MCATIRENTCPSLSLLITGLLQYNYTPLHLAALENYGAVCRLLISSGADSEALDEVWLRTWRVYYNHTVRVNCAPSCCEEGCT